MGILLTDIDIEYVYDKNNPKPGVALVWAIDGQCLYDTALSLEHAEIFLSTDEVVDISDNYPEHDGIVVRLLKNHETLLELMTSEYFGNILLSTPKVLKLADYPYGIYVVSPNALFDGEKFIITNRDVSNLPAWPPGHEPQTQSSESKE